VPQYVICVLLLTDGPDCSERNNSDFIKMSDGCRLDAIHLPKDDEVSMEGAHWLSTGKEHAFYVPGSADTSEVDEISVTQLQDNAASKQNEGAPDAPNEVCNVAVGCAHDVAVHLNGSDSDIGDESAAQPSLSEYSEIYNHPAFDTRHHQWKVLEDDDMVADLTERSEEPAAEAISQSTAVCPGYEDEDCACLLDNTDDCIVVESLGNVKLFQKNSFEVTVGNAEPDGLTSQVSSRESERSYDEMRVGIDVERMMNSQETGDGTTSYHSRLMSIGVVDEESRMHSTELSDRAVSLADSDFKQYPVLKSDGLGIHNSTSSADTNETSMNFVAFEEGGTLLAAPNNYDMSQESVGVSERLEKKIASDHIAMAFAAANVAWYKPYYEQSLLIADEGLSPLSQTSIPLHRTNSMEDLLICDKAVTCFTGPHKSAEVMNLKAAEETPQLSCREKSNEADTSLTVTSGAAVVHSSDQLLNTLTASSAVSLDTGFSRRKPLREDVRLDVGILTHNIELNQNRNTHDSPSVSGTSACSAVTDYSFENVQDFLSEAEYLRRVPDRSSSGSEAEVSPTCQYDCDLVDSGRTRSDEDWITPVQFMNELVPSRQVWSDYIFRPTGLNPIDESVEWLAEHDTSGDADQAMDHPTEYDISKSDRAAPQDVGVGMDLTDSEDMAKQTVEFSEADIDPSSLAAEASELSAAMSCDLLAAEVSNVIQKIQLINSAEVTGLSSAEEGEGQESDSKANADNIRLDERIKNEDEWGPRYGLNAVDCVLSGQMEDGKAAEICQTEVEVSVICQPEVEFRLEPTQERSTNGEVVNESADVIPSDAVAVNAEAAVDECMLTVPCNSEELPNKAAKPDLLDNIVLPVQNAYDAVKLCEQSQHVEAKSDAEVFDSAETDLNYSKQLPVSEVLIGNLVQSEIPAVVEEDEFSAGNSAAEPTETAVADAIEVCQKTGSTEPEVWSRQMEEVNLQSDAVAITSATSQTECADVPLYLDHATVINDCCETDCNKDFTGPVFEANEATELYMHDETLAIDEVINHEAKKAKTHGLSGLQHLSKDSSELSEMDEPEVQESLEFVPAELNEMNESSDFGASEIIEALEGTPSIDQDMAESGTCTGQCDEQPVTSLKSVQCREVLEMDELLLDAEAELPEYAEIVSEGEVAEIADLEKLSGTENYQLDQSTNLDLEAYELYERDAKDHWELGETPQVQEAECVASEPEELLESEFTAARYTTTTETVAVFADANAEDAVVSSTGHALLELDRVVSTLQPPQPVEAEACGTSQLLRQDDEAMLEGTRALTGVAQIPEEAELNSRLEPDHQQTNDTMNHHDVDQQAGISSSCGREPRPDAAASSEDQTYATEFHQRSALFESGSDRGIFSHFPFSGVLSAEVDYREDVEPTCEAEVTLTYELDEDSIEANSVHALQTVPVKVDTEMMAENDVNTVSESNCDLDTTLLHHDVDVTLPRYECQAGNLPAVEVKDIEENSNNTVGFKQLPLDCDRPQYQDEVKVVAAGSSLPKKGISSNDTRYFNCELVEWTDRVTILTPLALERAEEIVEQAELTEFFDVMDLDEGDATATVSEVQSDISLSGSFLLGERSTNEKESCAVSDIIPSFTDANESTEEHRSSLGASETEANEDLSPYFSISSEVILRSRLRGRDLAVDSQPDDIAADVNIGSRGLPRSAVGLDTRRPNGSDSSFACAVSTSEVRDVPADSTPTDLLCNLEKMHSMDVKIEGENSVAQTSHTDVVPAPDQLEDAALEITSDMTEEQSRDNTVLTGGSLNSTSAPDDATAHR
jgi:hypothetical protein